MSAYTFLFFKIQSKVTVMLGSSKCWCQELAGILRRTCVGNLSYTPWGCYHGEFTYVL